MNNIDDKDNFLISQSLAEHVDLFDNEKVLGSEPGNVMCSVQGVEYWGNLKQFISSEEANTVSFEMSSLKDSRDLLKRLLVDRENSLDLFLSIREVLDIHVKRDQFEYSVKFLDAVAVWVIRFKTF